MHYGIQSFSKNNKDTIRAISGANIGQRDGFSKTDIIKLNSLYSCHCKYSVYLIINYPRITKRMSVSSFIKRL